MSFHSSGSVVVVPPETTPADVLWSGNSRASEAMNLIKAMNTNVSIFNSTVDNAANDSNSSGADGDPVFDRWLVIEGFPIQIVMVPVLFAILFLVGIIGNGTLIVSVIANKVMRNVPNILIVSLSLGDFILVLISVPTTSTLYTFFNWPYGLAMCKLNEFLQTVSLGVSVFTLMALSADRYVAIVDPMAKLTGRTQRTTIFVAISIWVLSILFAIPDAVFSTELVYVNGSEKFVYCYPYQELELTVYPKVYYTIRLFVYFIIPVLTIGFFYALMARMLIRSKESFPMESKTGAANHQRQIAARKKVAYVVMSFVLIFFVCWLPRHIFLMWFHWEFGDYNEFWHVFKIVSFCLTYVNSCVNPFALYFLSGQFRKYYNRYLFCCFWAPRYASLEPTSAMHNLNSTTRRSSPTNTSMVHSQSMC